MKYSANRDVLGRSAPIRIGFIGNFTPSFSTENDRKWSFEKLGYKVITYQESQTTFDRLMADLKNREFDILFYSHTHGWNIPHLVEVFKQCKNMGVPTVSVHLDRWAWLDRVVDVGREATWATEYIFMADGSPEAVALYNRHNLNWHFLKPGVVERECRMVSGDKLLYPHEIVFVGSYGYHPEYPGRPQLIDFLRETYGDRFAHYGGDADNLKRDIKYGTIRGMDLNYLYATAKIVVGDSCFGGRPNYWSDRVPETCGRGGFLLHPKTEGQDIPHESYIAGDLQDLKRQIDYYVENEEEREVKRKNCFEHVKKHDTYTNRALEIIETIYGHTS